MGVGVSIKGRVGKVKDPVGFGVRNEYKGWHKGF